MAGVAPDEDPDDRAPSRWLRLNEASWQLPRLLGSVGTSGPLGAEGAPPALVLPGFLATDGTTAVLRRALAEAGWRVHPWTLGVNKGATADMLDRLGRRLEALHDERKILLVGWSLGGLFARELARHHPDKVRAVVTLGSPFSGDVRTNTNVRALYEWVAGHRVDDPPIPRIEAKPPVPTLALWSRRDGIVSIRAARGLEGERDRAVEIESSHMGFAVSRRTQLRIIAEIRRFLEEFPAVDSPPGV